MKMNSKVAFITGCSSGLGFATVQKLIESGYIVYATMRNFTHKEQLQKACMDSKNLHILKLDLADDCQINAAVNEVLREHESIDALIHNAASALIGPVDSATADEVQYLFQVNLFSVIKLTQLFLPAMRKKRSGHILFIGSISGVESAAYQGVYCSTKFALEAVASSWATTLHKWNIKVTILEPGAMNTDLPNKIPLGSYYSSVEEDPYSEFNRNILAFLKDILRNGKNPKEVAQLILDILGNERPNLRYQTCDFSKELVSKHLKDPEGNQWVEEHRKFMDPFYRKL